MLTILNSWHLPVFHLRSIAKWPHIVKAHIGGSKIKYFLNKFKKDFSCSQWVVGNSYAATRGQKRKQKQNIRISH